MGREARLVSREQVGLGDEVMHVELFGSQPLPTWMHRPHLSGRFVSVPASLRFVGHDAEVRAFPGVLVGSSGRHFLFHTGCFICVGYNLTSCSRSFNFFTVIRFIFTGRATGDPDARAFASLNWC